MGDHQLLALFGTQRAVQGQRQHAQQAVERCPNFVAHVRQKRRAGMSHVQRRTACYLKFLIGLAQAQVAGLELVGACRDDVCQFVEVVGQPVLGCASPGKLAAHAFKLTVERLDQYADFILGMVGRAGYFALVRVARIATAQLADHPHQRLGQGRVKQNGQNAGQRQAADEAVEQGDFSALQKMAAEREGVHGQVQRADGFIGQMIEVQFFLKLPAFAEQPVAEHPITPGGHGALDAGEHSVVVVGKPGADHGR